MKKICIITLSTLILGAFFVLNKVSADDSVLSQKEVADLARPSVVKIIQHVKGEATVPVLSVNFKTSEVAIRADQEPHKIEIDEYLTGSGIIVNPDGYILTNSHVISYQTIKNLIVSDFIYQAVEEGYSQLSQEEAKKLSESSTQETVAQFGEKIADYALSQSQFNLEKNLVVLNPTSNKETLEELVGEGFPATVISVNDNFFKDSRDTALLKIDQLNLPAIGLDTASEISTGKKVYIFGYPSTAEVNEKDVLVPTFTQGSISATKDSLNKDFKILQTDAKISRGSSGGPLLDEQGRVVGLVTFITSDLTKQDGDSFAFALPVEVAKNIATESKISGEVPAFKSGTYFEHFNKALALFRKNQCKQALEEFSEARKTNENFPVAVFTNSYEKQCQELIASGKSVDSVWDKFIALFSNTKYLLIFIIGGGLILIGILAFSWYWFIKRIRQDAQELDNVEEYLHLNLEDGTPTPGKDHHPVKKDEDN